MPALSQFVQDTNGTYSATRLGFLAWVLGVLGAWIADSVAQRTLQPIPQSVATILGVLMTGKVVQRFGENPPAPAPPPAPANVVVGGRNVIEGQPG